MARVRDDDVFEAVAGLVAAGEYLDDIPGRPGVDMDGGGWSSRGPSGAMRRMYRRGSRRHIEARERGWIEPLPPLRPASLAAVEATEAWAGVRLPPLLRRLYLEVANGGFGPGYGVAGLRADHPVARIAHDEPETESPPQPQAEMTLCDWGCAIATVVDLADGQIWGYDPNPAPAGVSAIFPQHMTVADWFGRWIDGRLQQPWLMQDPVTGVWRGATEAESQAMIEEAFGPDGPDDF
jgi:hypothetical protein